MPLFFVLNNYYTIIIPVFNEASALPKLLRELKLYHHSGHEIIIINDGSTDESLDILHKNTFIKLIHFNRNKGKGYAIKKGLLMGKNNNTIIFDGDLEIHPKEIQKLMILDSKNRIHSVFANRFQSFSYNNIWDLGNLIFNKIFNKINHTNIKDPLCCAKSFRKTDINIEKLKSSKFDIDVEISSKLVKVHKNILNVNVKYDRRNKRQGKKLKLRDSFQVLKRILS